MASSCATSPAAEIKARVEKTLSQIGLGHLAARYPHQLSGGQQQRVAIARALVYEPPVILLDEPLSNLDAKLREEARAWLRTLIVTLGLSAIHVTHDQVEAMAIADRVVLLDAGVIAQEGSPTALYNDPATLFAAEFMGSNNRLDGKLVDNAGGRATMEMFGERLTGQSRTKAANRHQSHRHHPHRARALRVERRAPTGSRWNSRRRCISASAGNWCLRANRSRCGPTPRRRSNRASITSNSRPKRCGCFSSKNRHARPCAGHPRL